MLRGKTRAAGSAHRAGEGKDLGQAEPGHRNHEQAGNKPASPVHPGVSRLWLKANASLTSGTMNDHLPSGVLRFWFGAGEEYGRRHKRWFEKDPSFDAEVSKRFLPLYEELAAGAGRERLESRADGLARFPHRNAALGRASTPEEIEFLKLPGSRF